MFLNLYIYISDIAIETKDPRDREVPANNNSLNWGLVALFYMLLVNSNRSLYRLTYLNRIDLPTLISRGSLFTNLGLLGGIFHFIQIAI